MFAPLTARALAAHRSVPTGPACKKAPESSTPEQTACYLQPCCRTQVKPTRHIILIFHREINSDELPFTPLQPPSTHMKSMFKSLVSLSTSFILSLTPSLCLVIFHTHLLLWVTVINDTHQRDHSSICSSFSVSSFLSLLKSFTPPSSLLNCTLSHLEGLMLKSATRYSVSYLR